LTQTIQTSSANPKFPLVDYTGKVWVEVAVEQQLLRLNKFLDSAESAPPTGLRCLLVAGAPAFCVCKVGEP
jgi:hypothetical protein